MHPLRLNFATTLKAVRKVSKDMTADLCFHKFSSLPLEIRVVIWEDVLPPAEAERPVLFSQTHSHIFSATNGLLADPEGKVPICMTTTCAALLHVNQESRRTVLKWAERHGYEVYYRALCRRRDDLDINGGDLDSDSNSGSDEDDDHDHEKWLPVQGPIFVRGWDARKDILHVFSTATDYGIPSEWDQHYVDGKELRNVQHLAFNTHDIPHLLESPWFLQLLAAIPDLKSLSFNYDDLEIDGEPFYVHFVETQDVGDPWTSASGDADGEQDRDLSCDNPVQVRWETARCKPEELNHFRKADFKQRLMESYKYLHSEGDYQPPERCGKGTGDDNSSSTRNTDDLFDKLPPRVWDREKGDFAFELRAFRAVERRGYEDVKDGLVASCEELFGYD